MRRDHRYLADVVEAADLIAKFLTAKGQSDFLSDDLLHNAVLRQLIIVGEAVTHLSTEFCASHPEIPVRPIANFRHRLVHDYSGVDMDLAWRIATGDLPILREQIMLIIAAEFGASN